MPAIPLPYSEYWVITVWQPWADLIMRGWKPFEFRKHLPPSYIIDHHAGIHAGKRPMKREEITDLLYRLHRGGEVARATGLTHHDEVVPFLERIMGAPMALPTSAVLGICEFGVPIRDDDLARKLDVSFVNDSDRDEHSNWGWPVKPIGKVRPHMPRAGKQGFWHWKPSQFEAVVRIDDANPY